MSEDQNIQKKKELHAFIFLTAILAPLMAIVIVGGYGLLFWLYQIITGPPAG